MNNILLGAYGNLERDAHEHVDSELDKVISALIRENKSSCRIREAFDRFDTELGRRRRIRPNGRRELVQLSGRALEDGRSGHQSAAGKVGRQVHQCGRRWLA